MNRRNMHLRTDGFIRNIHTRNPFDVIRADIVLARIEKEAGRCCGMHFELYQARVLGDGRHGKSPVADSRRRRPGRSERGHRPVAVHCTRPAIQTDAAAQRRGCGHHERNRAPGARFVALQGSRNGESLLAANMGEGVRVARDYPDSGVVVRLAGDDRPWNPGAITGGGVWADKIALAPGADPVEVPLPSEVLAQRAAEEAQRQQVEKQAEQTAREVAGEGRKAGEPEERVKEVIGDVIRGLERDRPGAENTILPDDPQTRRQEAAVQQVVSESLQRERLQQMERDMVRDLNREKTLGGD